METKEINIAEILKDCPKGAKLYSPAFGDLYFDCLLKGEKSCIATRGRNGDLRTFFPNGNYYTYEECECALFPSKDQRDWSKFVKPVLPPFEVHQCKDDETYYLIDENGDVAAARDYNIAISGSRRFRYGNYFNTREQAEYAAEKVKELLLALRKEQSNE